MLTLRFVHMRVWAPSAARGIDVSMSPPLGSTVSVSFTESAFPG